MNSHEVSRRYNFSDADLIQAATQQLRLIARDAVEFAEYNFGTAKQAEYEAALSVFSNFPADTILEANKMVFTERKNETRKKLESSIRDVQFIAKLAFQNKPAYIKPFGNAYLTKQTDNELIGTYRNVQKSIDKYQQQLADFGLSAIKISLLEQSYLDFQNAFSEMDDAIKERDISTNDRIEAANKLYNLYSIYAQLGQHIWAEKNEAKYNDYIIYDTPSSNNTDTEANEPTTKVDKKLAKLQEDLDNIEEL